MNAELFEQAMGAIHRQKQDHGVHIDGRIYSKVQDRIEVFRRYFGGTYGIVTNIDYSKGFRNGTAIVASCMIVDMTGNVVASGHACEFVGSSYFTDVSPVEVAETSAIGRALAAFGLHGGEYASIDEINAARGREGLRQQGGANDERETEPTGSPPPSSNGREMTGYYVPSEHEAMWSADLQQEQERILNEIYAVENGHLLGRYWNELKPFLAILAKQDMDLASEIRAAFTDAHNKFQEQR